MFHVKQRRADIEYCFKQNCGLQKRIAVSRETMLANKKTFHVKQCRPTKKTFHVKQYQSKNKMFQGNNGKWHRNVPRETKDRRNAAPVFCYNGFLEICE